MSTKFLTLGPNDAPVTILLAHGAGGAMDSTGMNEAANALAQVGFRVARFEFGYMAARRVSKDRLPPPRAETLIPEYESALADLAATGTLVIGGKSMGGRIASMIADRLYSVGRINGLLCLGYPFHPIGQPDKLRTQHLAELQTPTLICQGTRDQFGTQDEVSRYTLSKSIEILWLEDGDHGLKPRKKVSGFTAAEHLATMAAAVKTWAERIAA
ncbi:alpha/beta family hydrolase [Rhizobium tubonense]|uniref:Alpha/beta hydrolase n=1 Tax=Rhizobium tubonense TaxID=484088 RepID=A0A2W4CW41_9HYPH|nr:alpha/beta family hydrolase [Rhizobium tubonense]PZM15038.1 alpha/beta hydrolase [Rhizobium tubonense]